MSSKSERWWTPYGMEPLDEKHIMMLGSLGSTWPAGMSEAKSEASREAFFNGFLPVLTLRFDGGIQEYPDIKPLKPRNDRWVSVFLMNDFDAEKIFGLFMEDPISVIEELYDFVVLERAKTIREKLWVRCPEAFLLGLAFYEMHRPERFGCQWEDIPQREQKTRQILESLDGNLESSISALVNACSTHFKSQQNRLAGADGTPPVNVKEPGNGSSSDSLSFKPVIDIRESRPQQPNSLVPTLQDVSSKFVAMKERYEKAHGKKNTAFFTGDRRLELLTLVQGASTSTEWEGHAIMDNIWKIFREGPIGPANRGYNYPQASQWLILSSRMRTFCLRAGNINSADDPVLNIQQLRQNYAEQQIFSTADLHSKMQQLQLQNQRQEKIIMWLSFRYLLENLPPDEPGVCATEKWEKFWDAIWNEGNPTNAGLKKLKDKYENKKIKGSGQKDYYLDKFSTYAKGLYSLLSVEIHGFREARMELDKDTTPLGEYQFDILQSLMPKAGLNAEDLNWEDQRKGLGYIAAENSGSATGGGTPFPSSHVSARKDSYTPPRGGWSKNWRGGK